MVVQQAVCCVHMHSILLQGHIFECRGSPVAEHHEESGDEVGHNEEPECGYWFYRVQCCNGSYVRHLSAQNLPCNTLLMM